VNAFLFQHADADRVYFVDAGGQDHGIRQALGFVERGAFSTRLVYHVQCPQVIAGDVHRAIAIRRYVDLASGSGVVAPGVTACTHTMGECRCLPDGPKFYFARHSQYYFRRDDYARMSQGDVLYSEVHHFEGPEGEFNTIGGYRYTWTRVSSLLGDRIEAVPTDVGRERFDNPDITAELLAGRIQYPNCGVVCRLLARYGDTFTYLSRRQDLGVGPTVPAEHVPAIDGIVAGITATDLVGFERDRHAAIRRIATRCRIPVPIAENWFTERREAILAGRNLDRVLVDCPENAQDVWSGVVWGLQVAVLVTLICSWIIMRNKMFVLVTVPILLFWGIVVAVFLGISYVHGRRIGWRFALRELRNMSPMSAILHILPKMVLPDVPGAMASLGVSALAPLFSR
jgi:hypothetical protein